MVQVFVPVVATREPIRLCWTKVSALSTAPGMSCMRASVRRPAARLPPFVFAARKPRRDLEPAAAQCPRGAAHGDLDSAAPGTIGLRHTADVDRALPIIHGVIEMAEVARLFAEPAGDVRIRPFLERRTRASGTADQQRPPPGLQSASSGGHYARESFRLVVPSSSSPSALASARPAISDSVDVKFDSG